MLFAGYYGRGKIGSLLRRTIIGLYLASGMLIVSNLVQITYAIRSYVDLLSMLALMEYPFQPATSLVSGVASFTILIVGTIGATYYFARATALEVETAH